MKAAIIANGQFEPNARLRDLWRDADLRIAADGGARNARLHLHLAPHVIVGDLDSLDDETTRWLDDVRVERIQHPRAKDQSDLELAVDLAQARAADDITLLGAFGGRPDQMLANLFLMTRSARVRVADAQSEMWLARNQTEIVGAIGDTVSLIPMSETVEGILTSGLAYPLNRESLLLGTTRGVSNELSAPHAQVRFESGLLFVIHLFSKDQ